MTSVPASPLPPALQGCDQVKRSLPVSALAGSIAALLRDVLELTDHAVDLIVRHPPNERRQCDAYDVDVVYGFHEPSGRTAAETTPET